MTPFKRRMLAHSLSDLVECETPAAIAAELRKVAEDLCPLVAGEEQPDPSGDEVTPSRLVCHVCPCAYVFPETAGEEVLRRMVLETRCVSRSGGGSRTDMDEASSGIGGARTRGRGGRSLVLVEEPAVHSFLDSSTRRQRRRRHDQVYRRGSGPLSMTLGAPLSPSVRAWIREQWVAVPPRPKEEIARIAGVCERTVCNVTRDLPRRPRKGNPITEDQIARIVKLYRRMGIQDVADVTRHDPTTITKVLRRAGVQIRKPGMAGCLQLRAARMLPPEE